MSCLQTPLHLPSHLFCVLNLEKFLFINNIWENGVLERLNHFKVYIMSATSISAVIRSYLFQDNVSLALTYVYVSLFVVG